MGKARKMPAVDSVDVDIVVKGKRRQVDRVYTRGLVPLEKPRA